MLVDLGAEIILANTYHLHLRPGDDLIARARRPARVHGLVAPDPHRLGRLSGVQPRGAPHAQRRRRRLSVASRRRARSLTPESAADIQARLGSDIAMMFDECPSWPATERRRRRRDGAHAAMGAPRPRRASRRCRSGGVRGRRASDARTGAVRHRAGRHATRTCAIASVAGTVDDRIRGLRHRRPVGGGADRRHVRHRRRTRPRSCPRTGPAT